LFRSYHFDIEFRIFGFQHIGEQLYNFRQVAIDDVRESHEEQPDNPEHHSSAGLVEVTRMLYVIHGVDKPRSPVRARLAEAHQSYLTTSGLGIVGSGPLMDDAGESVIGTVIIVDCADRGEIVRIMANEPFNRAGLYESLHITRWEGRQQSDGEQYSTTVPTETGAPLVRPRNGDPVPGLDVPLMRGGHWRLADQAPEAFTLILIFTGVHCSFCKPEVEELARRRAEFTRLGIETIAVSMDDAERAERMLLEWEIGDLPVGFGMTEAQARSWGLYVSRRVKPVEPEIFAEPGLFLVRPDGTLYAAFQSTSPWLRPDLSILLRGIKLAMDRGTPPRGEA
jgi:peroxiredoxin/uncharacterized protein YciI